MRGRVVLYSLLVAGLAAAFYFNSNADAIYAQLGNRYYKQNNIKKSSGVLRKIFCPWQQRHRRKRNLCKFYN